ncbi:hypothetical protein [Subtercola lobariae]|uniref:Uncharacterized protein n=1 Tax=Subtercola lobariae TaxID=1588641 RepID=A0A917B0T0_9MICO|nr:hypothetical protein [Subtercola lobariae]GGF11905.1 hypothetical protein GCM10011399_02250 [Subtercola lobariae]
MAQPLLPRIFGAGKLPAVVRDDIATEVVLFRVEGIWVSGEGSFKSPGRSQGAGVRMHFGAFRRNVDSNRGHGRQDEAR